MRLHDVLLSVTGDPYFETWGWFVGIGLGALALGTVSWGIGCARFASRGYPLQAVLLAGAGVLLGPGQVLGSQLLTLTTPHRFRSAVLFGLPVEVPNFLGAPDNAPSWAATGLLLGVLGVVLWGLGRHAPAASAD